MWNKIYQIRKNWEQHNMMGWNTKLWTDFRFGYVVFECGLLFIFDTWHFRCSQNRHIHQQHEQRQKHSNRKCVCVHHFILIREISPAMNRKILWNLVSWSSYSFLLVFNFQCQFLFVWLCHFYHGSFRIHCDAFYRNIEYDPKWFITSKIMQNCYNILSLLRVSYLSDSDFICFHLFSFVSISLSFSFSFFNVLLFVSLLSLDIIYFEWFW